MEANTKKHLEIIGGCSLAGLIVLGGIWMHQQDTIADNEAKVQTEMTSVKHYNHAKHDFTESKLERSYDRNEPNLGNVLNSNSTKVKKGMQIAFSQMHKLSDYTNHTKLVKKLLGSSVGGETLSLVKPQEAGASDSAQSISDTMTGCNVSYGEFDSDDDNIPVMIVVNFNTPKIDNMSGAGASDKHQYKVYQGQMVISADLNVKSGTMTEDYEHAQVNNQQLGDTSANFDD